jgi:hypothetical protein
MATFSFGTSVNPGFFVEIVDAANPGQTKRPPAGTILKVRSAADLSALPDVVTGLYGYWGTTTTDVPEIQVSGDGGSTWSKSLQAVEALSSAIGVVINITSLQSSVSTNTTAISALSGRVTTLEGAPSGGSGAVSSVAGHTGAVTLLKGDVGLGNVDNTSDVNKPVSTVQQAALDAKAPVANPSFTGTVAGVTKAMVGLSAADNTADVNKPISTLVAAALARKLPYGGTFPSQAAAAAAVTAGTVLPGDLVIATGP